MGSRRFPKPWQIKRSDGAFIVTDANGFALSYVYVPSNYDGLGTLASAHLSPDEALRIARAIARLPELIEKERLSTAQGQTRESEQG